MNASLDREGDGTDPEAVEWRPAVGYEGTYEVSADGQVRSLPRNTTRGGVLSRRMAKRGGYWAVNLVQDGRERTRMVHTILAEAFLGPRPSPRHQVRHLDGDALNCTVTNLAWGTPRENMLDRIAHGTDPNASKTECLRGHPYDAGNTYVAPGGVRRSCRACQRARRRVRTLNGRTTAPRRRRSHPDFPAAASQETP
jgi:hypothetical protein